MFETQKLKNLKLKERGIGKMVFAFLFLISALVAVLVCSLVFLSDATGAPKKTKIIFQEARQWQIAADSLEATLVLRPNATGTATNLNNLVGASTHWGAVDEDPSDGDNSYVGNLNGSGYFVTGSTQYDLYELPNHTTESGIINSVTVYINVKQASSKSGEIARTVIKTENTEYRGKDVDLPASGDYFVTSTTYTTNPSTTAPWTWDEVDALQVGVELKTTNDADVDLRATQVWAVIDYNKAPILNQNHYRWRDDSTALNTNGGWLNAADTVWSTTTKNAVARLRVEIANTGDLQATGTQYQLEYAKKVGSSCGDDEVFFAVPTTTVSAPFEMIDSSKYANGASTTVGFLAAVGTFATGTAVENPSNKTSVYDLATSTYTEFEYALKVTNYASDSATYCFRLTNNGTTTNFKYTIYPEITLNLPLNLTQYGSDHNTIIPVGGNTASTTVYLDFDVNGATSTDVLTPKVEVRDINTSFSNTLTATGTSFRYDPRVPRSRDYPSFVYDPDNHRAILFGGKDDTGTRVNDTWELLLPTKLRPNPIWRELSPGGTLPEGRNAAAFIYDARYKRLIVFGGYGQSSGALGDFWALDFSTTTQGNWHQFSPTGTLPAARYLSSAIYDSANQRMIIFGGYDGNKDYNDTWEITLPQDIDNSTSTQLNPGGTLPSARDSHSTIYDAPNKRLILFGGYDGSNSLNDTWELNFSTTTDGNWRQLSPSGTLPGIRDSYAVVYDSQNQRMIVSMGLDTGNKIYYNDIWELPLSSDSDGTWTDESPAIGSRPKGRYALSAIYDEPNQRMVLFGGYDGSYYIDQPLEVSLPAAGTLYYKELSPEVNITGRDQPKTIYDPLNHRAVMFSGYGRIRDASAPESTGAHLNETWSLSASGTVWRNISPSIGPQAREGVCEVYDSVNNRMIMFGGLTYNQGDTLNDVWALSLSTSSDPIWTQLHPTGTPPLGRWGASCIYDPVNTRMLIFGGATTSAPSSAVKDVWELNFTTSTDGVWTERTPATGGPSHGRWMSAYIYDPVNTRMLIFGGSDGSNYYNKLWELSFTSPGTETWTDRTPATSPSARDRLLAIYQGDYSEKRMIIFGGYDGNNVLNDVWKCDITTPGSESWTQITPKGTAPLARRSHTMVYSPDNKAMYMYGGRDSASTPTFFNDLWQLSLPEATTSWTWTQLSPIAYLRASVPVKGLTAGSSYHWQAWWTGSVSGDSSKAVYGNNSDSPLPASVDFAIPYLVDELHYRWRNDNGKEILGDWTKKKPIYIYNSNANDLTNYQVKLDVSYDSDMKSDFSDLRFTNSDENKILDYWIENYATATDATVWVKIPSLPSKATTTVYMYYGNPSASSTSNGSTTFAFFDDFDPDKVNWTSVGGGGIWSDESGYSGNSKKGVHSGVGNKKSITDGKVNLADFVLHAKVMNTVDNSIADIVFRAATNGNDDIDRMWVRLDQRATDTANHDGGFHLLENVAGTEYVRAYDDFAPTTSHWYDIMVKVHGPTADGYLDGVHKWSTSTLSKLTPGYVLLQVEYFNGADAWFDNVFISKYATSEPSVTFGNENFASGATWKAAEDTAVTNQEDNENVRLRFLVKNSGVPANNYHYRLQYAPLGNYTNCNLVPTTSFADVPTSTGQAVIMATSSYFIGSPEYAQASTTHQLSDVPGYSFASGKMVNNSCNQTNEISLVQNYFTELEYDFRFTDIASASTTYCFRVSNSGLSLNSYDEVAPITTAPPNINISGTVFSDEGNTSSTAGSIVSLVVNGVWTASTTADSSTGAYSFSRVYGLSTSTPIAVYLDNSTEKGITITKTINATSDITNLDIYKNRIIVRHEGSDPITIDDLAKYDSSKDSDILYSASSTAGTLIASSTSEFYVWPGKTFDAYGSGGVGGNISLSDVDINGTFVATSTQVISVSCSGIFVGGSCWDVTGGTFESASSTVKFTSTTTDKNIITGGTNNSFWNVEFDGSGGGWTFASGDHKISNNFTIIQGTVTSTSGSLYVGGNWSNSGTFNHNTGTVVLDASSGTKTINTGSLSPFNILILDGSAVWQLSTSALDVDSDLNLNSGTLEAGSQDIKISGDLSISSGFTFIKGTGTTTFDGAGTNIWTDNNTTKQDMGNVLISGSSKTINLGSSVKATKLVVGSGSVFNPESYTFTITGSGTGASRPFVVLGTFSADSSIAEFTGASTTDIESIVYHDLKINHSGTIFQLYNDVTTTNNIDIATGTLDVTSNNYNLIIGGSWSNSGTFLAEQGTITFNSSSTGNVIDTGGTSNPFYNLIFDGSGGGWTFASGDHKISNNFTIIQGTVTSTSGSLYVGGNWLVKSGGVFEAGSGTVIFDAWTTGKTINPGSSPFNNVTFNNTNGGWTIISNSTSTNNWSIINATSFVATSSVTIEVKGKYIIGDNIPSVTIWEPGSVLYLNSGDSYVVGDKTQEAEDYAKLDIGANTDIRMWNSTATSYIVDSSGSLYSQNHNNSNGSLYVWGDYHTTSTDYWSYSTDFDGTNISGSPRQCRVIINSGASVTVDNGATLEIKGGGSGSSQITTVDYAPGTGSWNFNNNSGSELTFQEARIGCMKVNTGTVTVLNTVLSDKNVPADGAVLNVDWYLGIHAVMVDSTSTPVANATATISENSSTSQSTIWKWSDGGWGVASTTQSTLTDSSGYIPQPGNNGAVRIREYSMDGATTTYYKYNLRIIGASGFQDYDYYTDQGNKYISSVSSTDSDVDTCIGNDWQRDNISVNNTPEVTINDPPTNGSWYVGLNSDLEFGISSLIVNLGDLNEINNFTATATTILYVTTTAPNGYLITVYDSAGNNGELVSSTYSIPRWPYNNDSPAVWNGNCVNDNECGFGYTTDDNSLSGGAADRFATSTKYAGFTSSTEEVADRGGGTWHGERNIITYKVSVPSSQHPAVYNTTIEYICTANY